MDMIDSREGNRSAAGARPSSKRVAFTAENYNSSSFRLVRLVKKPSLHSQDSAATVSTKFSKCSSWSDLESSFASLKSDEEGLHLRSCMKVKTQDESLNRPYATKGAATKIAYSPRFSTLEIHHHPILLGDNPSVMAGVPLTIDWRCQETAVVSVDEYEKDRPPRRDKNGLGIPAATREDWLRENGFTYSEIVEARRKIYRLQRERLQGSPMHEKWDEGKQSLGRKVKRWILKQPSDRALCDSWREQQVAYCLEKQKEKERSLRLQSDTDAESASAPP